MALAAGNRLGPYEIRDQIGAGGMGEVYRAADTRLDRTVAIKVLPEHLADDRQRRERFEREAKAVSSLNHPHICTLHDVGEQDGIHYLVMEYVEGETLQQRLEKGRLPLDQALEYTIQIADALDKAHRQGVVHRDLKPGNIMITKSGTKLLDFGLAKLKGDAGEVSPLSQMPTEDPPAPLTAEGTILGTLQYMAPEQLEGKEADARTDIFAFGAVAYEMVTGKKAFEGASQASLIAAIIEREAQPLIQLHPTIPRALDRVVMRCLAKDPDDRWQSAADLMHEVKWVAGDVSSAGEPSAAQSTASGRARDRRLISSVAVVTLVAIVTALVALVPESPAPKMILEITTPPTTEPGSLAISPDGKKIVFVATSEGEAQLLLRSLESGLAEPLPRTVNPTFPFWSPDSRSIGFFADQKLKRIDIDLGVVRELADAPVGSGGSWNSDDVILFAPAISSAIFQVPAAGGLPVQVTQQAGRTASHIHPRYLPDGRHFIYRTGNRIYVTNLDGLEPRLLLDGVGPVDFHAPSGQLLFTRQGVLFAQAFDLTRSELSAEPEPVAEEVQAIALSASAAGPIVYRSGTGGDERQLAWFDRSGKEIERVGDPIHDANAPTISPDGNIVAFQYRPGGNFDIGLLDMDTGFLDNLTFSAGGELFPVWSTSGRSVAFGAARSSAFDLYEQSTAGGEERLLFRSELNKLPTDWTADGSFLLYRSLDPAAGYDLWALRMDGGGEAFPVVQTDADDREGQFSPDGGWIAYQSNRSGQFEIYVQPFPGPGRSRQISPSGGTQVRWRADGRELFYIGLDERLMAVPMEWTPGSDSFEPGRPVALFPTKVGGALQGVMPQQYAVSSDGERFLMNLVLDSDGNQPITVILNWQPGTSE